jgi:hypothetical protein
MTIGDFLQQFGEAEQAEMLRSIRDRAVPLVAQQLSELQLAPLEDQAESSQGAQIAYALHGVRLADVELPRDRIACGLEDGAIKLQLADISAKTHPFEWRYQKDKLNDAGTARASISHADVTLLMELAGDSLGDSRVKVRDCKVRIQGLEVQLGGTVAGGVQSTLMSAFAGSISRALESALEEHLRRVVPAQAAELFTDDDDAASTSSSGSGVDSLASY